MLLNVTLWATVGVDSAFCLLIFILNLACSPTLSLHLPSTSRALFLEGDLEVALLCLFRAILGIILMRQCQTFESNQRERQADAIMNYGGTGGRDEGQHCLQGVVDRHHHGDAEEGEENGRRNSEATEEEAGEENEEDEEKDESERLIWCLGRYLDVPRSFCPLHLLLFLTVLYLVVKSALFHFSFHFKAPTSSSSSSSSSSSFLSGDERLCPWSDGATSLLVLLALTNALLQFFSFFAWAVRTLLGFPILRLSPIPEEGEEGEDLTTPLLDGQEDNARGGMKGKCKKEREKKKKKKKEKGNNSSRGANFTRLIGLAHPERYIIFAGTVALMGSSGTQMLVPLLFGQLTTIISPAGFCKSSSSSSPSSSSSSSSSFSSPSSAPQCIVDDHALNAGLDRVGLQLLCCFLLSALFTFFRASLFTLAGERLVARVRQRLFRAVLAQEIAFFDEIKSGELTNRLSSDTTVISDCVTVNVSMGLRWLAQAIIGIIVLFLISPTLTLVMLTIVPAVAISAVCYGRFIRDIAKAYQGLSFFFLFSK